MQPSLNDRRHGTDMKPSDAASLTALGAPELRRLIGTRALSPVELLDACIARIEAEAYAKLGALGASKLASIRTAGGGFAPVYALPTNACLPEGA